MYKIVFAYFLLVNTFYAQDTIKPDTSNSVSRLFSSQDILNLKLSYSNKGIKKNTNDSTFIKTDLSYKEDDGSWKTLEVELRARGNFRRRTCYFPPIKLKIKKSVRKGTLFEDNKKLKLVVPCLKQKSMNDMVVKEYMAYKLYEIISPYHYKTRMVTIDFTETRGKKTINHKLKGFLIEDIKKVADRHNGKVYKGKMHPMAQDATNSVRSSLFQYLIANTDYSTAYQHNQKLVYIDKKIIPIPFDFDLCGLVNTSYSLVSTIEEDELPITEVTQRLYRGFKRDEIIFRQIRKEYLNNRDRIFEIVNSLENDFDDPKHFSIAKSFIQDFYKIITNDVQFKDEILRRARTK